MIKDIITHGMAFVAGISFCLGIMIPIVRKFYEKKDNIRKLIDLLNTESFEGWDKSSISGYRTALITIRNKFSDNPPPPGEKE